MPKSPHIELLDAMRARVGIKEIPGPEHNPLIVSMFADVGHPQIKDDETAWCAAAVGSALKSCDLPIPPRDVNLLARSYLSYGVACQPQPGAIGVWPRGNSDWQGHVGVVETVNSNGTVTLISGNDGSAVRRKSYPVKTALGFRLPVAPTVADLRKAGSKEVKTADRIETTGIVGTVGAIATAVVKELNTAAESIDITSLPSNLSLGEQIISGASNVWRLVSSNPWLAAVVVVGLGAVVASRAIKRHRVERAKAGVPLSAGVMAETDPVGA